MSTKTSQQLLAEARAELDRDQLRINTRREIIAKLRGPGGCPWARAQTHDSIKGNLLEEAYEVLEAIDMSQVRSTGYPAIQRLIYRYRASRANGYGWACLTFVGVACRTGPWKSAATAARFSDSTAGTAAAETCPRAFTGWSSRTKRALTPAP